MRIEDLDFGKLRAFQLVATHGTLAAAATQLGLTVPAISAKLKRLDETIGAPLFRRLPNGLALTQAGERFLRDLTPVLQDAEAALRRAQAQSQAQSDETGTISVAIGGDYTSYFVPRMHRFIADYPRVDITMRVARTSDSLAALQSGRADFCMGVYPRLPQGVSAKVVARTSMTYVTRAGRTFKPRADEDEEGRLIVAPRGTAVRQLLRKSTLLAGRKFPLQCPTCQAAIDLVALGTGPAIVHTICLAGRDLGAFDTRDLAAEVGQLQFVVAYRRGARRSSVAQAFFDYVTA